MKTVDLNKLVDQALNSLMSSRALISDAAQKAIIHAMPKKIGDDSHGDTRPLVRLVGGLVEQGADKWAQAVLWYIKDNYPVFRVVTTLNKWEVKLVDNHKDMDKDAMVKAHGAITPASYERVISEADKEKKAASDEKRKQTLATKKKQAANDAMELAQLREQNKALLARINELNKQSEENPAVIALGKAQDRLRELESILKASEDARANLRAACDRNDARIKGMESVISSHVETIKQHVAEIAALRNVVSELRVVKPAKVAKTAKAV